MELVTQLHAIELDFRWSVEEAITIPVMTRSECGKKGKGASFWSKMVIPSREEIMKRRKLTYIAN